MGSSNKFGVEKSLTSISLVTLSQFFPFSQSLFLSWPGEKV